MTTVALTAALAVLRIIRALLFAFGMGALATAAMSWLFRSRGDASRAWAENVATLAIEVAAIGLVAAVVSWRRLPSMTQVRRRIAPMEPNHRVQVILLSGLAIGALLQLPLLLAWFTEDRALLLELLGPRPDPRGLHLVPAAILYSLPTLAAVLLVLFATTSLSASLASRTLAYRFLTADGVMLRATASCRANQAMASAVSAGGPSAIRRSAAELRSRTWQITDGQGQVMADVRQSSASFHQTMYTVTVGGEDVCRLTAVMGATAASSEVQVEFLPARAQTFDRSLAVALAPIIEDRTRRARWT